MEMPKEMDALLPGIEGGMRGKKHKTMKMETVINH
jgi:hypothetical protein